MKHKKIIQINSYLIMLSCTYVGEHAYKLGQEMEPIYTYILEGVNCVAC